MAATDETGDRRAVPRWKSLRDALRSGELDSASIGKGQSIDGTQFILEKEKDWAENKSISFAVDLVSAAVVLGRSEAATDAAEFILSAGDLASPAAITLAEKVLGIEVPKAEYNSLSQGAIRQEIAILKNRRIEEKRNAFVWLDLARSYMLLGHVESANDALRVAYGLAPYDRFVLRSLVRFLLHTRKPDEALQLLRSNPKTPSDPWLVASETALSSVLNKTPKFIKLGQRLVQDSGLSAFHTSELASALGSFEMFAGNNKSANKMFRLALRGPNDNALAQIVWSSKRTGFKEIEEGILALPNAAEAVALDHHNNGRWSETVQQSKVWADEESFSSRPYLLASGVSASLLKDPKTGLEIAKAGLPTNPGHPGLLNNIAFCHALLGHHDAALNSINQIDRKLITTSDAICLLATIGLAHFRAGNVAEGVANYEASIDAAKRAGKTMLQVLAKLYFGRELHLKGDPRGQPLLRDAYEAAQKLKNTTIPAVADKLVIDETGSDK